MNYRQYKPIVKHIVDMVGEAPAGYILAGVADALDNFVQGKGEAEIRKLTLVFNNFFEFDIMDAEP